MGRDVTERARAETGHPTSSEGAGRVLATVFKQRLVECGCSCRLSQGDDCSAEAWTIDGLKPWSSRSVSAEAAALCLPGPRAEGRGLLKMVVVQMQGCLCMV